jgi:mono/diheme cytochrome c family protein
MRIPMTLVAPAMLLWLATAAAAEEVIRQAPIAWNQAAIADGEDLFQELCAVCHGRRANGYGPAAVALKKRVPDLTGLATRHGGVFPRAEVEAFVTGENRVVEHGTVDMPIWGRAFASPGADGNEGGGGLASQRIYNIAEYLASIQVE